MRVFAVKRMAQIPVAAAGRSVFCYNIVPNT